MVPANYPVIGIAGLARTGKDTVANFIIAAVGGYRYSFADPIRDMLRAGLGIDMNDPYWQERKEEPIPALGVSPRHMMQTLGTEWGRNCIKDDLWLLLAQQQLLRHGVGMVIPDIRFENEADWVRRYGGRIIHLSRPEATSVLSHVSESGIERRPEDVALHNNGTLDQLQDAVRRLLGVI